ncbi:Protein of unknown function [Bacillus mycoides]|nr:Protein of unknown function [Bacillus mycoides]
MRSFDV